MNQQQTQEVPVKLDFNLVLEEYRNRNGELEQKNIMNTVFIRQLSQEIADLRAKLANYEAANDKPAGEE